MQIVVAFAIGLQIDGKNVRGREDFQGCVEDALAMIEALNQVVHGLDRVEVETLLVDDDVLVVVDALADASHEGLVLRDAPQ